MKFKLKITRPSMVKDSYEKDKLISLKNSQEFLVALAKHAWKLVSLCMRTKAKTQSRTKLYYRFGLYLLSMDRRHGSLYVVKYLKAAQLSIQKRIAGQPFSSLREIEPDLPLPRLTRSGLPRIIGTRDRRAILSGSCSVIQLYLTLFGIYRVISADVIPKINTITDPYSGDPLYLSMASQWLRSNSKALIGRSIDIEDLKVRDFKFLETASPSNKVSWRGMVTDFFFLLKSELAEPVFKYLEITGSTFVLDLFYS